MGGFLSRGRLFQKLFVFLLFLVPFTVSANNLLYVLRRHENQKPNLFELFKIDRLANGATHLLWSKHLDSKELSNFEVLNTQRAGMELIIGIEDSLNGVGNLIAIDSQGAQKFDSTARAICKIDDNQALIVKMNYALEVFDTHTGKKQAINAGWFKSDTHGNIRKIQRITGNTYFAITNSNTLLEIEIDLVKHDAKVMTDISFENLITNDVQKYLNGEKFIVEDFISNQDELWTTVSFKPAGKNKNYLGVRWNLTHRTAAQVISLSKSGGNIQLISIDPQDHSFSIRKELMRWTMDEKGKTINTYQDILQPTKFGAASEFLVCAPEKISPTPKSKVKIDTTKILDLSNPKSAVKFDETRTFLTQQYSTCMKTLKLTAKERQRLFPSATLPESMPITSWVMFLNNSSGVSLVPKDYDSEGSKKLEEMPYRIGLIVKAGFVQPYRGKENDMLSVDDFIHFINVKLCDLKLDDYNYNMGPF